MSHFKRSTLFFRQIYMKHTQVKEIFKAIVMNGLSKVNSFIQYHYTKRYGG